MAQSIEEKTLALAGMFQAAELVNQIAVDGRVNHTEMENSLKSLFVTDPQNAEEVFGGIENVKTGLRTLVMQLGDGQMQRNVEIARYAISLIHLSKKLLKKPKLLDAIADGLRDAERQSHHFGIDHDNVIANLADTYGNTISTLTPRIMVHGSGGHLAMPDNANRIRALLLAGIRAGVLWHQSGGSRIQLLFRRRAFVQTAHELLNRG